MSRKPREVMGDDGSLGKWWESVSGMNKDIGNPLCFSEFLPNRLEVVE
jgi:hypothetical protein